MTSSWPRVLGKRFDLSHSQASVLLIWLVVAMRILLLFLLLLLWFPFVLLPFMLLLFLRLLLSSSSSSLFFLLLLLLSVGAWGHVVLFMIHIKCLLDKIKLRLQPFCAGAVCLPALQMENCRLLGPLALWLSRL